MAEFDIVDLSGEEPRWRWLASTLELQRAAFGWDWDAIRKQDDYPEVLARSTTENFAAAVVELGEAMAEVGWKSWATKRGWVNRQAFLTEVVDAAHFIANMLVAVGVTDAEYEAAYQAKQQVNRDRMASGTYDGVSDKCPDCRRAYTGERRNAQLAYRTTDVGCWRDSDSNFRCETNKSYGVVGD